MLDPWNKIFLELGFDAGIHTGYGGARFSLFCGTKIVKSIFGSIVHNFDHGIDLKVNV